MATRTKRGRKFPALGIGMVVGFAAWLALNLAGIANQLSSVGQYFPAERDEPAGSVSRGIVEPVVGAREVPASASESMQFDRDVAPREITPNPQDPDYVAAFEVLSPSVRAPLPDTGRLVMDPTMFLFDENDAELQSAVDELLMHPDEEVRQVASENLLPAVRR
jgi:hypothetical protein